MKNIRVLVVGLGNMGLSHARAYQSIDGIEIAGLCSRNIGEFVEVGKTLGKPLVMRMNLNQQSSGAQWEVHKHLMNSISPIVDWHG